MNGIALNFFIHIEKNVSLEIVSHIDHSLFNWLTNMRAGFKKDNADNQLPQQVPRCLEKTR